MVSCCVSSLIFSLCCSSLLSCATAFLKAILLPLHKNHRARASPSTWSSCKTSAQADASCTNGKSMEDCHYNPIYLSSFHFLFHCPNITPIYYSSFHFLFDDPYITPIYIYIYIYVCTPIMYCDRRKGKLVILNLFLLQCAQTRRNQNNCSMGVASKHPF